MAGRLPLSAFWLLYLAGLGLVFPYQALYFRENVALAGLQLGLVLAVRPLVGMMAQPGWGWLADRTGSRGRTLVALAFGTAVAYGILPLAAGFPAALGAMALAALFSTSVMPMATSVTMASLGHEASERFGRVRVWGTVGFLAAVATFPTLLERLQDTWDLRAAPEGPSEPGLGVIFWLAGGLSLVAAMVALRLPREGRLALRARPGELGFLLRHPPYRRLLAFAFGAHFCHQGAIQLFPVFVRAQGGSAGSVSDIWIGMLLVEIPFLFFSGSIVARIGARGLFGLGILADGLRWTVCAWSGNLAVIQAMMALHGLVVAGIMVGAAVYVEQVTPERLRSTGQGGLAMMGISLAGVLSTTVGGTLLDLVGPTAPYWMGGTLALALAAALPLLLPEPRRPEAPEDEAAAHVPSARSASSQR